MLSALEWQLLMHTSEALNQGISKARYKLCPTPPQEPLCVDLQINRMNKEELKRTLTELVAADTNGDDDGNIATMLQTILDEVKTNRQERIKTEAEIKSLTECNVVLTNTVIQQQRFLQSLDAEKRIRNLILTGIQADHG